MDEQLTYQLLKIMKHIGRCSAHTGRVNKGRQKTVPGGFSWHGFTLSFAFLLSETQRGSDRSHLFFAASASVEKTSQFMSNRGASPVA